MIWLPGRCIATTVTDSLNKIAEEYFKNGDYDLSLEYNLMALKIAEKGSCNDKALGYLLVGRNYYHLQQKKVAIQYFKEIDRLPVNCIIDSFKRTSYRFLGSVYLELGKTDSGKFWLEKAEKMLVNTQYWGELSSLYAVMGEMYHAEKQAKKYFDLAEQYAIRSKDTSKMAFAIMKQGMYAIWQKNCDAGERYILQALGLYRNMHLVEGEMYGMKVLGWALSECGRAKETYDVLTRFQVIRDSIFKSETAEQVANFRTMYETEKKEKENAELARQNVLKELEIARQLKNRRVIVVGFLITILLLVIAFLYKYSRYKLQQQKDADRKMAEQQQLRFAAVIEAEENERKRIASDLHDGIGQTMSAAKINLSMVQHDLNFVSEEQRNAFEKIKALVDESCSELRTVSHNMMPNALLKLGLASAIRNFINQIDHRVLNVDFYSEGLDESLNVNSEVVLYRVIQECVNNVIKHAHASTLHISMIKDEDGISVTVEDNGRGFVQGTAEHTEGIGIKNIRSRVSYLKGTVEWNTMQGKGTAVIINIHVPQEGMP